MPASAPSETAGLHTGMMTQPSCCPDQHKGSEPHVADMLIAPMRATSGFELG